MTKNKLLLLLALLLTAATGAMAQSGTPSVKKLTVPDTWTGDMTTFSAADLPSDFAAVGDDVVTTIPAPTATGNAVLIYGFSGGETKYVEYANGVQSATDSRDFLRDHIYGYVNIMGYEGVYYTAAAPTGYTVSLKDGVKDADKWTISPNPAPEGSPVTVTYSGSKKVIGVKAEKKAAVTYPLLSAATTSDYGKVVCAAGHLHDAKTAVPDGCTAVGILGKVTTTGHGLILALKDATAQNWNTINGWTSASYAGTTLKLLPDDAARGINLTSYTTLGSTAVSNWAVAQKSDYDAIFTNLGSTKSDSDGTTYDDNVNAFITTGVGGTAISGPYWSAKEYGGNYGWYFYGNYWDRCTKTVSCSVRPVLGF